MSALQGELGQCDPWLNNCFQGVRNGGERGRRWLHTGSPSLWPSHSWRVPGMEQGDHLPSPGKQQINKMPLTLGNGWSGSPFPRVLWSRHFPAGLHHTLFLSLQGGHRLLARFQSLEKRFEALEAELSRWELHRGAAAVTAGGEPPPGDILALLEGLVSRRDAGLKEHLRSDVANQLQVSDTGTAGRWAWAGPGSDIPPCFPFFRASWMCSGPRCRGI